MGEDNLSLMYWVVCSKCCRDLVRLQGKGSFCLVNCGCLLCPDCSKDLKKTCPECGKKDVSYKPINNSTPRHIKEMFNSNSESMIKMCKRAKFQDKHFRKVMSKMEKVLHEYDKEKGQTMKQLEVQNKSLRASKACIKELEAELKRLDTVLETLSMNSSFESEHSFNTLSRPVTSLVRSPSPPLLSVSQARSFTDCATTDKKRSSSDLFNLFRNRSFDETVIMTRKKQSFTTTRRRDTSLPDLTSQRTHDLPPVSRHPIWGRDQVDRNRRRSRSITSVATKSTLHPHKRRKDARGIPDYHQFYKMKHDKHRPHYKKPYDRIEEETKFKMPDTRRTSKDAKVMIRADENRRQVVEAKFEHRTDGRTEHLKRRDEYSGPPVDRRHQPGFGDERQTSSRGQGSSRQQQHRRDQMYSGTGQGEYKMYDERNQRLHGEVGRSSMERQKTSQNTRGTSRAEDHDNDAQVARQSSHRGEEASSRPLLPAVQRPPGGSRMLSQGSRVSSHHSDRSAAAGSHSSGHRPPPDQVSNKSRMQVAADPQPAGDHTAGSNNITQHRGQYQPSTPTGPSVNVRPMYVPNAVHSPSVNQHAPPAPHNIYQAQAIPANFSRQVRIEPTNSVSPNLTAPTNMVTVTTNAVVYCQAQQLSAQVQTVNAHMVVVPQPFSSCGNNQPDQNAVSLIQAQPSQTGNNLQQHIVVVSHSQPLQNHLATATISNATFGYMSAPQHAVSCPQQQVRQSPQLQQGLVMNQPVAVSGDQYTVPVTSHVNNLVAPLTVVTDHKQFVNSITNAQQFINNTTHQRQQLINSNTANSSSFSATTNPFIRPQLQTAANSPRLQQPNYLNCIEAQSAGQEVSAVTVTGQTNYGGHYKVVGSIKPAQSNPYQRSSSQPPANNVLYQRANLIPEKQIVSAPEHCKSLAVQPGTFHSGNTAQPHLAQQPGISQQLPLLPPSIISTFSAQQRKPVTSMPVGPISSGFQKHLQHRQHQQNHYRSGQPTFSSLGKHPAEVSTSKPTSFAPQSQLNNIPFNPLNHGQPRFQQPVFGNPNLPSSSSREYSHQISQSKQLQSFKVAQSNQANVIQMTVAGGKSYTNEHITNKHLAHQFMRPAASLGHHDSYSRNSGQTGKQPGQAGPVSGHPIVQPGYLWSHPEQQRQNMMLRHQVPRQQAVNISSQNPGASGEGDPATGVQVMRGDNDGGKSVTNKLIFTGLPGPGRRGPKVLPYPLPKGYRAVHVDNLPNVCKHN